MSYGLNLSLGQKKWCVTGTLRDLEKCFGKWRQKTKIKPIEPRLTFGFYDVRLHQMLVFPLQRPKMGVDLFFGNKLGPSAVLWRLLRTLGRMGPRTIKYLANGLTMPLCRAKPTSEKSGERGLWHVMRRHIQHWWKCRYEAEESWEAWLSTPAWGLDRRMSGSYSF